MISRRKESMILKRWIKAGIPAVFALAWLECLFPVSGLANDGKFDVFVSIQPQAYFVERVGGKRVRTEVLVLPGQNPHTFEPTPRQMTRLAEAELFLRIGVEFENTLMGRIRSTMPGLPVADCRRGLQMRQMESGGYDEHRRGNGNGRREDQHQDGREGSDPHVWLSVRNAVIMAGTVRDELLRLDPAGRKTYESGYADLVRDLEELDRRIERILAPVKGKTFLVFHPSFGYFADDYGLRQVAVETGGTEPSARQLVRLIEEAREAGVRVIFVQPQFSQESAETIGSEIGGAVVPIDPLARDYIENLERMAKRVEEGLR